MRQLTLILVTGLARATLAEEPAKTETSAPAEEQPAPAPAQGDYLRIPWTGESGTGVGFGYENGLWGPAFGVGVRVKVPLPWWGESERYKRSKEDKGPYYPWGVALRGVTTDNPSYVGARLDLFGQSPTLLNLVRIYGGGGPQVFAVHTTEKLSSASWGVGGAFGFEFFFARSTGFFIEVGGTYLDTAYVHDLTGAAIVAGMNVYPF
jgi:hypothetical protein